MNEVSQTVNPLLEIDTDFRTYLKAYTRSYQNHIIDGNLDYACESDCAVRQKILGLGGAGKLFRAVNTQDITAEAKHLFLKCDQVGPLKYPEIYDIVKKCSERLELVVPIVFVREDVDRPLVYSIASEKIDPCIILSKSITQMCDVDEMTLLIGCECGRIQNNHCQYNMAYTYLNANRESYKLVSRNYPAPVSSQLYSALSGWVKFGDATAGRAGVICLDKPGRYLETICGLFNKGYVDFYGRKQAVDSQKLEEMAQRIHSTPSRSLCTDKNLTELERTFIAVNEFLYCKTLYEWRGDVDGSGQNAESVQVSDIRAGVILGNGGVI